MRKKILIINGHPNKNAFNYGIASAYKKGAVNSGAEVKEIIIADLDFNRIYNRFCNDIYPSCKKTKRLL